MFIGAIWGYNLFTSIYQVGGTPQVVGHAATLAQAWNSLRVSSASARCCAAPYSQRLIVLKFKCALQSVQFPCVWMHVCSKMYECMRVCMYTCVLVCTVMSCYVYKARQRHTLHTMKSNYFVSQVYSKCTPYSYSWVLLVCAVCSTFMAGFMTGTWMAQARSRKGCGKAMSSSSSSPRTPLFFFFPKPLGYHQDLWINTPRNACGLGILENHWNSAIYNIYGIHLEYTWNSGIHLEYTLNSGIHLEIQVEYTWNSGIHLEIHLECIWNSGIHLEYTLNLGMHLEIQLEYTWNSGIHLGTHLEYTSNSGIHLEIHLEYAWNLGIHLEYTWGIHLEYTWNSGIHLEYTWNTPGIQEYTWSTLGIHLEFRHTLGNTLGIHLEYTWNTLGIHPSQAKPMKTKEKQRNTLGIHLEHTWNTLGIHLEYTPLRQNQWKPRKNKGIHLEYTPFRQNQWKPRKNRGIHLEYTWNTLGIHPSQAKPMKT